MQSQENHQSTILYFIDFGGKIIVLLCKNKEEKDINTPTQEA